MPITVPDVARITIHGRWTNGHPMENVLDYLIAAPNTGDFGGGLAAQAVGDAWKAYMVPFLLDNYTFEGVSWVTLTSAEGTTGFYPPSLIGSNVGAGGNAAGAPNCSVLVSKTGASGRGQRNGRMYLPPCADGDVDENGYLTEPVRTATQSGVRKFLHMSESGTGDPEYQMVVVHFAQPRPPRGDEDNRVGTSTVVDDLFVQAQIATQRRRLRS